jgi:Na+-driven multidrug efflux pump
MAAVGTGVLSARILALAGPTAVVALLQVAAQLIETWLAARQGLDALAGWTVVLPFALVIQQMSAGAMGGGVSGAIARALGSGRHDEAATLVAHAVMIALVAGALFAIVLGGFAHAVIGAISSPAIASAAAGYAIGLFGLGAVPIWLANTLAAVLRGGGRHAIAARVLTLAWLGFPLFGWLFAEPLGMGLTGLGVGGAIAFWLAAVAMAAIVWQGAAGFRPRLRVRPDRGFFRRILSVGLYACAMAVLANVATIGVTRLLAQHGPAAVAGYGISARLEFLVIPLTFAVGSALTALVGRAVGEGDWALARRTAWVGALMVLSVVGGLGLAIAIWPAPVVALFDVDPQVAAIAERALSWTALGYGAFGLGMALYFAAQGAGRMRWPVSAALVRVVIAIGGGWLLAGPAGLGIDGYFIAVALGLISFALLVAFGMRPSHWSNAGSDR